MPPPTQVHDVDLPVAVGQVPLRVYGRLDADTDVLAWVHGGSWAHGSVEAWHEAYLALSRGLPLILVAAHYRSSYRAPFPAQLVDVRAALTAVRSVIGTGVLLAGGDSAGATLVAHGTADDPALVDGQLLAYPPIDPTCTSPTYDGTRAFPSRDRMRSAWARYAGTSSPDGLARVSPLAAGVGPALPPTSLLVGAGDPVRGDVEAYAARLREAGVTTRLDVSARVEHGDFLRTDAANAVHDWVVREAGHHLSRTRPRGERR